MAKDEPKIRQALESGNSKAQAFRLKGAGAKIEYPKMEEKLLECIIIVMLSSSNPC